MKVSIFHKRMYRILLAVLIGFVFACGAFVVQHTAEPLQLTKIDQTKIIYQSYSNVLTLYNGINQVKMTGYSGISGVPSKASTIKVYAVPSGGDPYSGYELPSYQYNFPDMVLILGSSQEYSKAGVAADCYVSQIPVGTYNIVFLTESTDGNTAYSASKYTFTNGLQESTLNLLFFLFAFAVYGLFAFACIELLYKGRNVPPGAPLPTGGDTPKRHSFLSILNIIFLALTFWIFLNITFADVNQLAMIETYRALYTVWPALLILIVMYSVWFGMDFSKKTGAKTKLLATAGVIVFILFQIGVCNSNTMQIPSFDSNEIAKCALSYWQTGGVVTYIPYYFIVYPNNYLMLFTDIGLMKLAAGSMAVFTQYSYLLNIALLDLSFLLTYLCIRGLFGHRTAFTMLLLLCLIIGLNPIMVMFYTDTLSMIILVLIFFLYLRLRKTKKTGIRVLLLLAIAVLTFIGYQYKMTVIILPIAIALVELVLHIRQWKKLLAVALSSVLVFGIVAGLNLKTDELTYQPSFLDINYQQNPDLKAFPFWNWVMIGLHYPYGTIDISDWNFSITRPGPTRDAETKHEVNVRLQQYGLAGYIAFLNNKLNYAFGQSTFSIGNSVDYYYNKPDSVLSGLSQDVFSSSGKWFPLYAYTLQGAWALCLLLISVPLFFRNKKKVDRNVTILRIALGGMIAYLMISENNPRQLVNQLPLILILASASLPPVMDGVKRLTGKARDKLKGLSEPKA